MLTDQQKLFFETFGFLLLRKLFSTREMTEIVKEADNLFYTARKAENFPEHLHISPFIELSDKLARLADDDRIYEPMAQLLRPDLAWGGSEGNMGKEQGRKEHRWHCDRHDQINMDYRWIKTMLYLEPMTKNSGALRVMAGSHLTSFCQALHDVQLGARGPNYEDKGSNSVFGLPGDELPCVAMETQPGDLVIFNQFLFHGVYGKQASRRYIAMKYVQKPETLQHLEALRIHSQDSSQLHERFRNTNRPRIQAMVDNLMSVEQVTT